MQTENGGDEDCCQAPGIISLRLPYSRFQSFRCSQRLFVELERQTRHGLHGIARAQLWWRALLCAASRNECLQVRHWHGSLLVKIP